MHNGPAGSLDPGVLFLETMRAKPFLDGSFVVCSATSPHWLAADDNGEPIWSKRYKRATKFTPREFSQMLSRNKWLEDAELWFHR